MEAGGLCWFLLSLVFPMGDVSAWVGWMIWEKGSSVQTLRPWCWHSCHAPQHAPRIWAWCLAISLERQILSSFLHILVRCSLCTQGHKPSHTLPYLSLLPVSMYTGMKRAVRNARYFCQLLSSQHHCHANLRSPCPLYALTPLKLSAGR